MSQSTKSPVKKNPHCRHKLSPSLPPARDSATNCWQRIILWDFRVICKSVPPTSPTLRVLVALDLATGNEQLPSPVCALSVQRSLLQCRRPQVERERGTRPAPRHQSQKTAVRERQDEGALTTHLKDRRPTERENSPEQKHCHVPCIDAHVRCVPRCALCMHM